MKRAFIRPLGAFPQTPAPVQGVVATVISSTEIDLTWTAIAGAQNYTVRIFGNPSATVPTTSANFTTLAPSTLYSFTVAAINTFGEGLQSAPVTATTQAALRPPGPVLNLVANPISTSEIDLTWSPVAGATNYVVTRNGPTVGSPTVSNYQDLGLTPATFYTYTVTATNNAGSGPTSTVSASTLAAATGQIVWAPGHMARTGTDGNRTTSSVSFAITQMRKVIAQDVNNQIKHFVFPFYWGQLEGPTKGVYDGSWDASGNSGFAAVSALIAEAKSYTPPRGICITVNCTANGLSTTNSGFPTWYAPAYMNSTTYGPNTGVEWSSAVGAKGSPVITFWNANTGARTVALIQAYYNRFGPDTATSGIYMWDPYNEMSVSPPAYSISNSQLLATLQNVVIPGPSSGMRAAAPKMMIFFRPTFLVGNTANASYQPLFNLMQASYIACGEEDTCNKTVIPTAVLTTAQQKVHDDWGALAYRGNSTFNGGTNQNWPNHVALNDWTFVCNVENAEQGAANNTIAVPPALAGSGYIYASQQYPGIMNGVNDMNASHCIWFMDSDTAGPNVNRGPFGSSASAPANPVGGPNPGSSAKLPSLVSLITNDPAYAALGLRPMPMPNLIKPPSWP